MKAINTFLAHAEEFLTENHRHLLPKKGQLPYAPLRTSHGRAQRVRVTGGKETYADANGMHWHFDLAHSPHWDVSNPREKARNAYIRVGPDGRIWEVHARSTAVQTALLLESGLDHDSIRELLLD